MIETWHQWTCDGCGTTENTDTPNMSKAEVYALLKSYGWRHYPNNLDYCSRCIKNGNAIRRETDMNH